MSAYEFIEHFPVDLGPEAAVAGPLGFLGACVAGLPVVAGFLLGGVLVLGLLGCDDEAAGGCVDVASPIMFVVALVAGFVAWMVVIIFFKGRHLARERNR